MVQSVLFVPVPEASCSGACADTNVTITGHLTVTGGVLLTNVVTTRSGSPGAIGVVLYDFMFQQIAGATNATVVIQAPCYTLTNSVDYPELIALTTTSPQGSPLGLRLCWNSRTDTVYQVQYSSELNVGKWQIATWENLGDPVAGNGPTNYITDPVASPTRFYRVVVP